MSFVIQMTTKIFLAYNDEDISAFQHPDIIPIKLDQTEYFESEIFRMLTPDMIPEADNIGIITPSLFKKVPGITIDSLFTKNPDPFVKLLLWQEHIPADVLAVRYHGNMYMVINTWLFEQLKFPLSIVNNFKGFYCNLWITKRSLFLEYLEVAKRAIKHLDSPPSHIQNMLTTDPLYRGKLMRTGILEKRFRKPYYPWQPFIMERLICAFAHLKETTDLNFSKE
jgi:hypothetical protein